MSTMQVRVLCVSALSHKLGTAASVSDICVRRTVLLLCLRIPLCLPPWLPPRGKVLCVGLWGSFLRVKGGGFAQGLPPSPVKGSG
jgi:hypothetical protein